MTVDSCSSHHLQHQTLQSCTDDKKAAKIKNRFRNEEKHLHLLFIWLERRYVAAGVAVVVVAAGVAVVVAVDFGSV